MRTFGFIVAFSLGVPLGVALCAVGLFTFIEVGIALARQAGLSEGAGIVASVIAALAIVGALAGFGFSRAL